MKETPLIQKQIFLILICILPIMFFAALCSQQINALSGFYAIDQKALLNDFQQERFLSAKSLLENSIQKDASSPILQSNDLKNILKHVKFSIQPLNSLYNIKPTSLFYDLSQKALKDEKIPDLENSYFSIFNKNNQKYILMILEDKSSNTEINSLFLKSVKKYKSKVASYTLFLMIIVIALVIIVSKKFEPETSIDEEAKEINPMSESIAIESNLTVIETDSEHSVQTVFSSPLRLAI
ncbi:hypothetical protein MJH12_19100, partial [bacterium]|nr:hypothetical protein [bacterium]